MEAKICSRCGANGIVRKNGHLVCEYCGTEFILSTSFKRAASSEIALSDDIARLLQKCKTDPRNAKRYANLILDIDPDNDEALKYL